jgi:hypothetical protein
MGKRMERACISGLMGRYMMGNGIPDLNMGMECGQARTDAIHTLGNGNIQRLRVMAFTNGKAAIDMKESGNSV